VRGPCCGASQGWRDRHGCACAAGSRGSSRGGGCSAGRCACSLGGSRNACRPTLDGCGASLGCHRAPTKLALRPRCTACPVTRGDLCPSEAGGSSHRQLDLVTVRAATPSGQTEPAGRHGPNGSAWHFSDPADILPYPRPDQPFRVPTRRAAPTDEKRMAAWHICTHPVDNDLNHVASPDYRGRTPVIHTCPTVHHSRTPQEPHLRGTRRRLSTRRASPAHPASPPTKRESVPCG
jgi:hypothetical protein